MCISISIQDNYVENAKMSLDNCAFFISFMIKSLKPLIGAIKNETIRY